ncbi:hypothetical protein DAPPUDRAFT_256653 [Daphnia pulex]|uniref:Uncharacterized protein n=1 Tax=Daphnia pulex TaxID=6669 RepID=E9HBV0_DAPPU|nr:hypothetical protein DAPPUDRAFT_256653 [Daphnia pulex]|eukprot:EFX70809.1 hypothetical protein DAPPUDRAFT_256653 [Daphnia pulex]
MVLMGNGGPLSHSTHRVTDPVVIKTWNMRIYKILINYCPSDFEHNHLENVYTMHAICWWLTIEKFVESNPQSRVAVLFQIRNKLRLVEQQGADREMLGLLGMKDSPSHSFSCDIIHQLENYVQVFDLVLEDHGWDEKFGPTNQELNQIYRRRLLDPELNPDFKKNDVISTSRTRIIELEFRGHYSHDGELIENGELVSTFEELALDVEYNDFSKINFWEPKQIGETPGNKTPAKKRKL